MPNPFLPVGQLHNDILDAFIAVYDGSGPRDSQAIVNALATVYPSYFNYELSVAEKVTLACTFDRSWETGPIWDQGCMKPASDASKNFVQTKLISIDASVVTTGYIETLLVDIEKLSVDESEKIGLMAMQAVFGKSLLYWTAVEANPQSPWKVTKPAKSICLEDARGFVRGFFAGATVGAGLGALAGGIGAGPGAVQGGLMGGTASGANASIGAALS